MRFVCQARGGGLHLRLTYHLKLGMWRLFVFWQRETWRAFWRRPAVYLPVVLAAGFVIANWFLVMSLPPTETVIMRYSIYVGTNWLAVEWWKYAMPGTATLLVALDVALAYLVTRSSLALRYLWLWTAVAVAAGFCWLSWLLVRING